VTSVGGEKSITESSRKVNVDIEHACAKIEIANVSGEVERSPESFGSKVREVFVL